MDTRRREAFEAEKRANVLQVLLKVARLVNERSLARAADRTVFRQALVNLVPHIALEGTRVSDLAAKTGVSKQATSRLVGEMAALGLVVVEADPADARARLVRFTPQGLRTIRRGLGVLEAVGEELAARVGAARMERLGRDLRALLDALEAPDGEPTTG